MWRRYRNNNCKFVGFSGGYSNSPIENIDKGSVYYTRFMEAVARSKALADAEGKTS
jgi:hypothetical protein